jgi:hypothetical protein
MMRQVSSLRAGLIAISLAAAIASPARADERAQLNACKALVDRAAQSQTTNAEPTNAKPTSAKPTSAKPDEAELQRCRQIIREWTLRDARMSVDENGKPLH